MAKTIYTDNLTASGKVKTYSYLRYSSAAQGEQFGGDSVRRQNDLIQAFLDTHNAEIVKSFEDLGISSFRGKNAKNLKTAEFAKFLQKVENGEIEKGSYLIVEGFDRISRQKGLNTVKIITDILHKHIKIFTLSDKRLYDIEAQNHLEQIIMITVINERAHNESLEKSNRQKAYFSGKRRGFESGKEERLATGIYPAMSKRAPWWLRVDEKGNYQPIPERVAEIKYIVDLMTTKGFGIKRACQLVNSKDSLRVWNRDYITKLIHEDCLFGHHRPYETSHSETTGGVSYKFNGEKFENVFPAVFTEEEILAVRGAFKERLGKRGGKKSQQQNNIFTGLAKCGFCGSPLRQHQLTSRGKKYFYLSCSASQIGTCITDTTVTTRYDEFIRNFFKASDHFDFNSLLNNDNESFSNVHLESKKELMVKLEKEERVYSGLQETISNLLESGEALPALYTKKIVEVEAKIKELKDEKDKLEFKIMSENRKAKDFIKVDGDFIEQLTNDIDLRLKTYSHLHDYIHAIYFRNKKVYFEEVDHFTVIFKNGYVLSFNEHFTKLKEAAPLINEPINLAEHGYTIESYVDSILDV